MNGSIRFVLRVDKIRKTGEFKGLCPIEGIYSLSGQRKRFYPEIYLFEGNWDAVKKLVKPIKESQAKKLFDKNQLRYIPTTVKEADLLNDELGAVRSKIRDVEAEFKTGVISASMVLERYKASLNAVTVIKDSDSEVIFDLLDQYIDDHELVRAKGSLNVYKALKRHLQAYKSNTKAIIKIDLINKDFFTSFHKFLIKRNTLGNVTINKQLSTLKTFLKYAKEKGVNVDDSYKDFEIQRESLEVIALTESEFYRILDLNLSNNKRLDQIRDVFCFSCMVGLRFSDISQLNRSHIKGNRIQLTVKKTKKNITVPLNAIAFNILEKYKDMAKPLPVISNQKYNEYIKEVCKLAEINEEVEIVRNRGALRLISVYPKYEIITSHSARKTFASMLLAKGVDSSIIMELGGWKDHESFKRYIKVNEITKEDAVNRFGKSQHLKAVGGAE